MTPPIATHAIRDEIAGQRAALTEPGARSNKRAMLHLIGTAARLCDALDQARLELRQRETYQELYGSLVVDYNGLIAALTELGIDVRQPMGSDAWHWRYGELSGSAPTIAAAYKAALVVAGCDPAEPGAAWAGERAAIMASAQDDAAVYAREAAERAAAQGGEP